MKYKTIEYLNGYNFDYLVMEKLVTYINYSNAIANYGIGRIFMDKAVPEEYLKSTEEMTKNIKNSLVESISESTWMDESTKKIAVEKAKKNN